MLWALRGGGGNFGVVTSLELALHPVGPEVLGGVVFYAGDEAVEVAGRWRDAVADAPDELTTLLNLTTAPPAPFIPEEWHFKKIAAVLVCWAGDPAAGESIVAPLRSLGTVVNDLLGPIPYVQLQQLLDPLWERGSANYFTSAFIDRLPDDAIATFADFHRRSADLPVQAELHIHHLGGAMGRVPAGATAFAAPDVAVRRQLHRADARRRRAAAAAGVGASRSRRDGAVRQRRHLRELHRRRQRRHRAQVVPAGNVRTVAAGEGSVRPAERLPVQPKREPAVVTANESPERG